MLQLRSSWEIDNILSREYKVFDGNWTNGNSAYNVASYIYSKDVSSALLPLAFSEIGIEQHSFAFHPERNTIDMIKDSLLQLYNNTSVHKVGIFRVYIHADYMDELYNSLDPELYTTPATPIPELYNKCMDQVRLRENIPITLYSKIKLMKGKNIIVLLTNFDDRMQASDYFLTVGLIPVLFPNLKEKFNDEEIEYFKTLVNRSQVKRISNVKATETFQNMVKSNKYVDMIITVKLQNTITSVVDGRIRRARERIEALSNNASTLLRDYEECVKSYNQSFVELEKLQNGSEELVDEIKTAIKIEGVKEVRASGTRLIETMKVPITFYNQDEVECILNKQDETSAIYKMLNETFIEQKYKLWIITEYAFSFDEQDSFTKPGQLSMDTLAKYNAWFNPHTYFYNCIGNYEASLRKAFVDKDLLMYNNIALASAKSINFRDGAVMSRWMTTINDQIPRTNSYNDWLSFKCFEDEDGEFHSFRELFIQPAGTIEPHDSGEEVPF